MVDIQVRVRVSDAAGNEAQQTATVVEQVTSRFPGDPGPGKLYSGSTVYPGSVTNPPPGGDAHLALSNLTGVEHAMRREYSTTASGFSLSQIDSALSKGQLPLHTSKFTAYTPVQIVASAADASLLATCNALKDPSRINKAVWPGYWHEPEDDYPTLAAAAEFRAAFRYIVMFFRAQGVPNVAWNAAMFMCDWSFRTDAGGPGRLWWWWDPDWKGTLSGGGGTRPAAADWYTGSQSVVDMFSFDQYSPSIGSQIYRTYTSNFDTMQTALTLAERPTKPFVIGEMGTKTYTGIPASTWATHWADAHAYFLQYNVVGVTYYNATLNYLNDEPTGGRALAYIDWVHRPEVLSADQIVF